MAEGEWEEGGRWSGSHQTQQEFCVEHNPISGVIHGSRPRGLRVECVCSANWANIVSNIKEDV